MRTLIIIFLFTALKTFAHPSVSIIMDSKGNVYYSDLRQVWKIDTRGRKEVVVSNVHTHELFLDSHDNLFGEHLWYESSTDAWKHYVWKLSGDKKLTKIIGDTKAFQTDYSFVQDSNMNLYIADYSSVCQKVIKKRSNGAHATWGDACFEKIKWMTCTPDGIVYLIDDNSLKKIDKAGHVVTVTQNLSDKKPDGSTAYLSGPSVDEAGNVYVSDFDAQQVKKIGADKRVTVFAQTPSPWSPVGSLQTRSGDFWILECSKTNEVRVEKITKDGTRIIY